MPNLLRQVLQVRCMPSVIARVDWRSRRGSPCPEQRLSRRDRRQQYQRRTGGPGPGPRDRPRAGAGLSGRVSQRLVGVRPRVEVAGHRSRAQALSRATRKVKLLRSNAHLSDGSSWESTALMNGQLHSGGQGPFPAPPSCEAGYVIRRLGDSDARASIPAGRAS